MQSPAPAGADPDRRPGAVLAVYSWDMLLALLALLGALAAFGGQAMVGSRTVSVGIGEQILAAVSSASFAGLLIILATLLTRRHRWVRRAQMTTLVTAIALGAVSLLLAAVLPGQGGVSASALTALLVLLIDAVVIVALTGKRIVEWYNAGGSMPRYITGTLGFWAATSVVLILLQSLR